MGQDTQQRGNPRSIVSVLGGNRYAAKEMGSNWLTDTSDDRTYMDPKARVSQVLN